MKNSSPVVISSLLRNRDLDEIPEELDLLQARRSLKKVQKDEFLRSPTTKNSGRRRHFLAMNTEDWR